MPQKCEDALIWQVVVIKWLNIGKPENHMRDDEIQVCIDNAK